MTTTVTGIMMAPAVAAILALGGSAAALGCLHSLAAGARLQLSPGCKTSKSMCIYVFIYIYTHTKGNIHVHIHVYVYTDMDIDIDIDMDVDIGCLHKLGV